MVHDALSIQDVHPDPKNDKNEKRRSVTFKEILRDLEILKNYRKQSEIGQL